MKTILLLKELLLVGRQEGHLACKNMGWMVEVGTGYTGWSGA